VLTAARANQQTDWACPRHVSLVGYRDGEPIPGEGITQIDVKTAKYIFAAGLHAFPSFRPVHRYHFGDERGPCRLPDACEDLPAIITRDPIRGGLLSHGLMDRFTHRGYVGFPRRANAALGIGKLGFFERLGAHLMQPDRAWGHMLRPELDSLADNRQAIVDGCAYIWRCLRPDLPLPGGILHLGAAKGDDAAAEYVRRDLGVLYVPFEPFRPGTPEWEEWCEVVA